VIPAESKAARRPTRPQNRWWLAAVPLLALMALVVGVTIQARTQGHAGLDWRAAITRGRADFATGSCISCHALYPISTAGGAIDLTHEGARRQFTWLQHEIRFPTSQRPPTPPGQADDLAAFLASLK